MRTDLSVRLLPDVPGPGRDLLRAVLERAEVPVVDEHPTSAVVSVPFMAEATDLVELGAQGWSAAVDDPLYALLTSLQDARRLLLDRGGAIVVVVPTIGVPGAASLVPVTTVVEGARAMAKSAARQWASDAIAVNMLALPLTTIAPDLAPQTAHLQPGASDGVGDPDIGRALEFLLRATPAMTGATVVVDGGQVMVP